MKTMGKRVHLLMPHNVGLHSGIARGAVVVWVGFEVVEEVDEVGIIELEPFGDGGGGHAAALGEFVDDLALEVGV
jgi:hypothetical protein